MKQIKLTVLLTVLMSMVGAKAIAHDIEVANADGVTIYYNFINDNTELEVTEKGGYSHPKYRVRYTGNVAIPASVIYEGRTYSVTSISSESFNGCYEVTSVTIPNTVINIDGLAFWGCKALTSISIPNSVINIGGSAFSYCTGLTSVVIGSGVTSIGKWLFSNCSSLPTIELPNTITSIDDSAFRDCSSLASISIPSSVTSIENDAFYGCTSLTSIFIPKNVTSINGNPFEFCSSLSTIQVESGNTKYDSRDNCNAIIQINNQTLIVGCKNTVIPNTVNRIWDYAFFGCSELTSLTLPKNITSIGNSAFRDCSGLTSVTISKGVTSIGNKVFSHCNSLASIQVDKDNSTFDSRDNCNAIIRKSDKALFIGCKNTIIPNSVTSIADGAFEDCTSLTTIDIPDNVKSIGNFAFWGCSNLFSVTIPNSVTSIGSHAFNGCYGLVNVISLIQNPYDLKYTPFDYNISATLYVPIGTIDKYKACSGWNYFKNILEGTPSGIEITKPETKAGINTRYTFDGKRINEPQHGLNIVKMSDGTTKKVVVK